MRSLWLLLSVWLVAAPAKGAIITGRDCANQDLVCDGATAVCGGASTCSAGDQLQGTFTRVRLFSVGAGVTVFVFPGSPLAIYASTIAISGTINAVGRGFPGGPGGAANSSGVSGTGGGPGFAGGGGGGLAGKAGGGGGYGGAGGLGPGVPGGGAFGAAFDSTGTFTSPISSDDAFMGSGGGGGGGGTGGTFQPGGNGGSGGGAIYFEASSFTFSGAGSILVNGSPAAALADTSNLGHAGGGGGGSGGGIVLRAKRQLDWNSTGSLSVTGGRGSDALSLIGGFWNPGAGGGGGRVKVFYAAGTAWSITFSTGPGIVGTKIAGSFDPSTSTANNGSSGTASFGILASSPTGAAVNAVYLTSVTWGWNSAAVAWGDAPIASKRFRVYASSSSAPLPQAQVDTAPIATTGTEVGLSPNSLYTRVVTAFTDWGDSFPSDPVSTVTYAASPGPPVGVSTFTDVQERQLTLNWGAGTGAQANPAWTEYEVWRSTLSDFSVASSTRLVALSSTPVNLTPETIYFFRVRAVNLAGTLTAFTTTFYVATSTTPPSAPGAPAPQSPYSYDGRATFRWAAGSAPSGIKEYLLQIGSFPGGADFLNQNVGAVLSYDAVGLQTGRTYFGRVRARSNANVDSDFSDAGPPVSVFITAQEAPVPKPIAWPNPADPTAGPVNVGFSLAEPAAVTLKIFTLNGRLVYQEERRFDAAGNQVWPWSGNSGSGGRVAPGGYIVVIEKRSASGVETQKSKLAIVY